MRASLVAAVLILNACESPDLAPAPESLSGELSETRVLDVAPQSLMQVAAHDQDGEPIAADPLVILGGMVAVRVQPDGVLVVEDVIIDLADVTVAPGVIGNDEPRTVTGIQLAIERPVAVVPTASDDGDELGGATEVTMLLDWAIVAEDGEVLPMATQRRREVPLTVEIEREDDGTIVASLASQVDGPIWDFSFIELADFRMSLTARAAAPSNP